MRFSCSLPKGLPPFLTPMFHNYNFTNKRVLLRTDFNVAIKNNRVIDDFRIQKFLQTIFFLRKAKAKIIILSHLSEKKSSLSPVAQKLSELLRDKVLFIKTTNKFFLSQALKKIKPGEVALLENLRLNPGEETGDLKFAKKLALLGDVFVQDSFSVCHRSHSSVVLLPKLLPTLPGPNLQEELNILSRLRDNPPRPLVVIIAGAKIESKTRVIEKFLKTADHLLLAGEIANMILTIKGLALGERFPQDEKLARVIEQINLTDKKIYLPLDVLVSSDKTAQDFLRQTAPGKVRAREQVFDIGGETIKLFSDIIALAGSIFWAGPLGLFEKPGFAGGTEAIAQAIAGSKAKVKAAGGGETIAAIRKFGFSDGFSFLSTGGGAMLEFLAGDNLPGLVALGLGM